MVVYLYTVSRVFPGLVSQVVTLTIPYDEYVSISTYVALLSLRCRDILIFVHFYRRITVNILHYVWLPSETAVSGRTRKTELRISLWHH
jgi:hypothetical protein